MKRKKKRPYRPPAVQTEKVYERKSLACGKTSPVQFNCSRAPKVS